MSEQEKKHLNSPIEQEEVSWGDKGYMGQKKDLQCHWAKIITDLRQQAGMSREQLAFESGVGVSTIENYERMKIAEPSIYKVEALLKAMGYELDAIFIIASDTSLPQ